MNLKCLFTSIALVAIFLNAHNGHAMQSPDSHKSTGTWTFVRAGLTAAAAWYFGGPNIGEQIAEEDQPQFETPRDPVLDRDNIVITVIYGTRDTQIIYEGEAVAFNMINRFAPYLRADITMEDGRPIAVLPGEFIVTLRFDLDSPTAPEPFYYLPASLLRKLGQEGSLRLRYRGRVVTVTCSKSYRRAMPSILKDIENRHLGQDHARDNLYRTQQQVFTVEANHVAAQVMITELEEALRHQNRDMTHYRYAEGVFHVVNDVDPVNAIRNLRGPPPQVGAAEHRGDFLVIEAAGQAVMTLTFLGDYLLVYLEQQIPHVMQIPEAVYFEQAPRAGVSLINLRELGLSPQQIIARLNHAKYENGILVLRTK